MIIDAKDLILGRLSSFVAKKALLGEDIKIINCEEAVISGSEDNILDRYFKKLARGHPRWGPFIYRHEDKFVKRVIRGMIPYRRERGKNAMKRIRCYTGIPQDLQGKKFDTIQEAHVDNMKNLKYLKVKDVCKFLGKTE